MIVLDASAAVDWLLQTSAGRSIENRIYSRNETLHAPYLLDLEVTQVLRRLALQGVVSVHCAYRKTRSYGSYTGWSTRFCFGPGRSRRALLIRRIAIADSPTHPLIVD